jgi:hypothetical protein
MLHRSNRWSRCLQLGRLRYCNKPCGMMSTKAIRLLGSARLLAEMGQRDLRRRAGDLHQPFERVGNVLDQEKSAGDR